MGFVSVIRRVYVVCVLPLTEILTVPGQSHRISCDQYATMGGWRRAMLRLHFIVFVQVYGCGSGSLVVVGKVHHVDKIVDQVVMIIFSLGIVVLHRPKAFGRNVEDIVWQRDLRSCAIW